MNTIGAFEAKTHFSQLLARVAHGETFAITRHGELIARLIPVGKTERTRENHAIALASRRKPK